MKSIFGMICIVLLIICLTNKSSSFDFGGGATDPAGSGSGGGF